MPNVKRIKYTIGGPEVTPGTAVAREFVLPIRALPGLDKAVQREADPAIIGTNMLAGEYPTADSIEGGIPLSPRPCGGFGKILKSLLGTEAAPAQIAACIRIRYTGAQASCKLIADGTGDLLTSQIGDFGSEADDAAFGTAGDIDLTAAAFDTVGELVAAIHAYADYECEKVFGADAAVSADIISVTTQGKGKWAYIWFTSATSGVYLHTFTADLSDTERPAYTLQADGFQSNFLRPGCVVNQLTLQAALKAQLQGEAQIMGMTETDGEVASGLTLEDVDPLAFHKGDLSLGAQEYIFTRKIDLTLTNNHVGDAGYGFGSISRQAHQKGEFAISGSLQLRLDADSYAERAKLSSGAMVALSYYFYGADYAANLPQLMLIELPHCVISAAPFTENNGVIDISPEFKATNPKGTVYDVPVTISILTKDSGGVLMGWKDAVARDLIGPKAELETLPDYWIRPKKYNATVGAELQALELKMANRSPTFAKLMSKAIEEKGEQVAPKDVFDACDVETRARISLEMAEATQEYGPRQTHLMLIGGIGDHNFTNDDGGKAAIDEQFVEIVSSNRAVLQELLAVVRSWNPPFSRSGPARSETQRSGSTEE